MAWQGLNSQHFSGHYYFCSESVPVPRPDLSYYDYQPRFSTSNSNKLLYLADVALADANYVPLSSSGNFSIPTVEVDKREPYRPKEDSGESAPFDTTSASDHTSSTTPSSIEENSNEPLSFSQHFRNLKRSNSSSPASVTIPKKKSKRSGPAKASTASNGKPKGKATKGGRPRKEAPKTSTQGKSDSPSSNSIHDFSVHDEKPESDNDNDSSDDNISCTCGKPWNGRPMIACDRCDVWYHMACEKVLHRKKTLPQLTYICRACVKKQEEGPEPKSELGVGTLLYNENIDILE